MDEVRTDEDPRIGEVLDGRYRIVEYVAGGAMADVYRAERVGLGREVAVKFLHPKLAADSAWVTRFSREAKAMSRLNHPNCVSVIDFGVAETPYIVMDFVTGQTLRELLDAGRVPFERAIDIIEQTLAGLAHAHEAGIVHRDIKPANILLTDATGKGDHVQVLDFGLARLVSEDTGRVPTTSKLVIGTPNYMSPEQSRGKHVDARSDVYSAGVVLFELLTGRKPFVASGTFEVLRMHQDDPRPSIGQVSDNPKLDRALDVVVSKSMARKPNARFESAIEMAEALRLALEVATDEPAPAPAGRRRFGGAFSLLLIVFAAGGIAAAWYLETHRRGSEVAEAADAAPVDASLQTVIERPVEVDAAAADLDAGEPDASLEDLIVVEDFDGGIDDIEGDAGADQLEDDRDAGAGDDAPADVDEPPGDEDEPTAPVSPPPKATLPTRVERIADARALAKAGRYMQAIRGLERLRRTQPKNAYIHLLLGHYYFQQKWWTNGLDSYRLAIKYKRKYRSYATVNKNAIRALNGKKTWRKASGLISRSIGRSALPFLRRAAKSDRSSLVRKRAAALVKRLSRRR